MTDPYAKPCDEIRLNLYLDGSLGANEMAWMDAHLKDCPSCRRQAALLSGFAENFRRRVQQATDAVDLVALEKQVLTKTLLRHRSPNSFAHFLTWMKYIIPISLTAGLLVYFVHTTYIVKSSPVPSAIINSFTGSVSSVMIFETPETRQTILWYHEETDVESDQDAV